MSWRTVVISNKCKLSYKNNYMLVRSEDIKMVHLSEINTLVIDTTQVSITTLLMCELIDRKIKIIFCDEKHNPKGELMPYYGSHNTSKKVLIQSKWSDEHKGIIWRKIVKQKITNQSKVLKIYKKEHHEKLMEYVDEVELNDVTNREGHSAKVYFNSLFGMNFTRGDASSINTALDYGYSILLSSLNKDIVSNGYITQLGINHRSEFNQFNLGCDLMEPFRPVVDKLVYQNKDFSFDKEFKYKLINVLNEKVIIAGGEYYLSNAIPLYVSSVFKAMESGKDKDIVDIRII